MARTLYFIQYPAEHTLDNVAIVALAKGVAHRCKMWDGFAEVVTQKPPVRHVHVDFPHRLAQGMECRTGVGLELS